MATLTDEVTDTGTVPTPKKTRRRNWALLLIIPAIILELFIHILPMLAGIGMSFLGLIQRYLRNWTLAPFVGLDNYKTALNFSSPIGAELLRSFLITIGYSILTVTVYWGLGIGAAVCL